MRYFRLLILVVLLMNSCKEDEYKPSGVGDALIIVKVTDTDTLFGLGLHAFSYDNFTSVYVNHTSNPDVRYNMKPVDGYMNDLSYESSESNFSAEIPLTGEYVFQASFAEGKTATFNDNLSEDFILPPKITACSFDHSRERIDISWENNSDVDIYSIKLYGTDNSLLFISNPLDKESTSYSLGSSSEKWRNDNIPEPGKNYIVEISTYKYEPDGGSFDLQSTGRIEKIVKWE